MLSVNKCIRGENIYEFGSVVLCTLLFGTKENTLALSWWYSIGTHFSRNEEKVAAVKIGDHSTDFLYVICKYLLTYQISLYGQCFVLKTF